MFFFFELGRRSESLETGQSGFSSTGVVKTGVPDFLYFSFRESPKRARSFFSRARFDINHVPREHTRRSNSIALEILPQALQALPFGRKPAFIERLPLQRADEKVGLPTQEEPLPVRKMEDDLAAASKGRKMLSSEDQVLHLCGLCGCTGSPDFVRPPH